MIKVKEEAIMFSVCGFECPINIEAIKRREKRTLIIHSSSARTSGVCACTLALKFDIIDLLILTICACTNTAEFPAQKICIEVKCKFKPVER